jgi:hypothetical protein
MKYSCDCLKHCDVAMLCCTPSPKARPLHLQIAVLFQFSGCECSLVWILWRKVIFWLWC